MGERKQTGQTILLVEDYADTRLMLRLLLEMSGYRVLEAEDGKEGVEVACRECPDIILMDLNLPVMDGLTAVRLIRESPEMRDVPIVAVSAHCEPEYMAAAIEAGCNVYVTKPIEIDCLTELIEALLPKT